jgi:hypothetical protein
MKDTMFCPQCEKDQRVSEPNAFNGRDSLRSTLACGHVVLKHAEQWKMMAASQKLAAAADNWEKAGLCGPYPKYGTISDRPPVGPCPCECNHGGFCGGCGHAGCGGR